ncbi:MAG: FAD:protein FMN transferase [Saprospiraceae bacterium]|nr:FAD:protein FMN transferase [Saprospiraceae bacterium]
MRYFSFLTVFLFLSQFLLAQNGVITLQNPSFEGAPNVGGTIKGNGLPEGWFNCGFQGESPPDVYPVPDGGPFQISVKYPSDGKTFIGLVTRDMDTWESFGQQLTSPLLAGVVYRFSIDLCRSASYASPSRRSNEIVNYTTPVTLRIWGGNAQYNKRELLATSPLVGNVDWKRFELELKPTTDHDFIVLEAFYKTPTPFPYNGNLMLDNASDIVPLSAEELAVRAAENPLGESSSTEQTSIKIEKADAPKETIQVSPKPKLTENVRHEFSRSLMGTDFRIIAYHADSVKLKEAVEKAYNRVALLEKVFSDYDENSEVSWLSKDGKESEVSDELWDVLQYALEVSRRSEGAFDVSVGALSKVWRKAIRQKEFPSNGELNRAAATIGYDYVKMKEGKRNGKRTIKLEKPGMQLDFGGIAAGYAVDEAMAWLREYGITTALVDGGGDILLGDAPPGGKGWEIEVPDKLVNGELAFKKTYLANTAITTSGDTYRYLEHEGKRYSHIIDPRTGLGLTNRRVVTVTAPTCIAADAWATAASVGISKLLTVDLKTEKIIIKVLEEK